MEKQKNILYIITKSNWGGAQKYVYDLVSSLDGNKWNINVAVGGNGELVKRLHDVNIETIEIPHLERDINILKEIKVLFFLFSLYKKTQPDIVHLNSSKIGLLGSLIFRLQKILHWNKNIKIIYTAHGWPFNENRSIFSRIGLWFLSWLTVIFSTETITIAKKEKIQGFNMPFVSRKINLIRNGIKNPNYKERDESRNILGLDKDYVWIGTISELHKNKGLDILIKAFAKIHSNFPNVRIAIIGEGEERQNIEKLITENNLGEKIKLLGNKKDAGSLVKAFDIFTLTSRKEGLPFALLEAGLAGLPVIAGDVGGIPEVVLHEKNGILFESKNINALSESMTILLKSPEISKKYGENLSEHIQNNFSFQTMISETIRLYGTGS